MSNAYQLDDRTVVVTGAGRGIGQAIAIRLAEAGANVVLGGRDQTALRATGSLIESGRSFVAHVDVTDEDSVAGFAADVKARVGPVDAVVCNSGIGGTSAPVWQLERADWEDTFAVNVTGAFLTLRAFLPSMIEAGRGSVILIGSMTGKRPLAHRTPYGASKMALVGLARTAALDTGPYGVRVNVVSPGFVDGERLDWVIQAQAEAQATSVDEIRAQMLSDIPTRRFVQAGDVADAVLFLASDDSASITGTDLNVTGGLAMH